MPRSLPVTTGRPWSLGRRDCSQEAKNASPSMCRIARGNEERVSGSISGVFTDNRTHHSRDLQFLSRVNRLKILIGCFQKYRPTALAKKFHGPLAIDLGNDNITIARFCPTFDQEHIPRQDTGANHGLAIDFEDVGCLPYRDQKIIK